MPCSSRESDVPDRRAQIEVWADRRIRTTRDIFSFKKKIKRFFEVKYLEMFYSLNLEKVVEETWDSHFRRKDR